jgi:serine/threonine protein kinase
MVSSLPRSSDRALAGVGHACVQFSMPVVPNENPNAKLPGPIADTLLFGRDAADPAQPAPAGRPAMIADSGEYDATLASDGPPPRAAALALGTVIADRYIIEEHVSSGGFGAVYRAADRQIRNHQVALKVLHTPAAQEQARENALRELTLIASVSHPSVVQFKDYGWYQGRLWFAMPWYRGATLAQRYAAPDWTAPITRAIARPIFELTAQGLAAMHEVGINHHDIKPDNIFLAQIAGFDAGLPVLLDLGIAATRGESPRGLTLEYASPELAASALGQTREPVGPAADVFSLALVLRNLLEPHTAQRIQGGAMAFLHKRATEPVPAPSDKQFAHMRKAFARWLHLDPRQRPSAAEFARELALLTVPEEQRAARLRMLKRVGPLAAAGLTLVLLLVRQVRREAAQLEAEKSLLDQQVKTTEELRARSLAQLRELDALSKGAGDHNLHRATINAKQWKALLDRSEAREESLKRQLRQLAADNAALGAAHAAVQAERSRAQSQLDTLRQQLDAARADKPKTHTVARRPAP